MNSIPETSILFENRKRNVFEILEHLPYLPFHWDLGQNLSQKFDLPGSVQRAFPVVKVVNPVGHSLHFNGFLSLWLLYQPTAHGVHT